MAGPWQKYQQAEGPWARYQRPAKAEAPKPERATDGMSWQEKLRAGVGASLVDSWKGGKQAATEGVARNVAAASSLLDRVGLDGASEAVDRYVRDPLVRSAAGQRKEKAERDAMNADLLSTGWGRGGQIAGTLAQVIGPGLALRGGAAAATFLPRTVVGNAGQGAALGYIQPADSEKQRLKNAAIGGGMGAAGAALPQVVGGTVRVGRAAAERFTNAGAARRAVREVQAEATNPAALMQAAPSQVPGVTRSLFAETLDPGVARMETRARNTGSGWAESDKANNAARVEAIRQFAGSRASLDAATAERGRVTGPLYRQAEQAPTLRGTDVLQTKLGTLASQTKGREGVHQTMTKLQGMVADAGTPRELMNVRDTITDMLAGRYAGDTNKALAGSRVLMQAKAEVERAIGASAPTYRTAQRTFRDLSRPINRQQIGQEVLSRGSGPVPDEFGNPMLTPAAYWNTLDNLDGVAASATGFRKARADSMLEPQDLSTLQNVGDDLSREYQRLKFGHGGNSHTASQQELAARAATRAIMPVLGKIPGLQSVMQMLDETGQRRLSDALDTVLQNPQEYRRIAASLPPMEAQALELALSRVGGRAGALSLPALDSSALPNE